jgi:hypothetical protein
MTVKKTKRIEEVEHKYRKFIMPFGLYRVLWLHHGG